MTPRRPMHPALTWALAASVLASAWAWWWPQEADGSFNDQGQVADAGATTPARRHAAPQPSAASDPTTPTMLSPAERDPFNSTLVPVPPVKSTTAAAEAAPPAPPPPPPPAAPPMDHRVIGRFRSPEGGWLVFVQDGDRALPAAAGLALASGWVVESVTSSELRLRHPLAEQAVSLPVPGDNPG